MREVRMPPPGQPGKAVVRPDPAWRVRGRFAGDELVTVTGRVVARVSSDFVGPHLVITDLPRLTFGGGHWGYVEYVTAQDGGLWATTRPRSDTFGPLVRLSPSLRVITPGSFRASPILARSEEVWSDGAT